MAMSISNNATRRLSIADRISHSSFKENIDIGGRQEACPVIRIPIDLPVYRMGNGRTTVAQIEHRYRHHLPSKFFDGGEESQAAQDAQYNILLRMAKGTHDIHSELVYTLKQTENLLITSGGVVINGNRRLAAMRDLYERNPQKYASFSHVDVLVLPENVTEVDLDEIEVEEQLRPETKQPYSWIDRLLKIRKNVYDNKLPKAKIASMYRLGNEEKLNRQILLLLLVDTYLEEYLGTPGEYYRVINSEQIFSDLQKARENKPTEVADYSLLVAFPVINESRNLDTRAYDYNAAFGREVTKVIDILAAQEYSVDSANSIDSTRSPDTFLDLDASDPLAGFTYDASSMDLSKFQRVRDLLGDSTRSKEAAERIKRAYETVFQQQQQQERELEALKSVEKAHTILVAVDIGGSDVNTHQEIEQFLRAINLQVRRIQQHLKGNQDNLNS